MNDTTGSTQEHDLEEDEGAGTGKGWLTPGVAGVGAASFFSDSEHAQPRKEGAPISAGSVYPPWRCGML